jgi:uncharacterized coiled-coil protein SlyX
MPSSSNFGNMIGGAEIKRFEQTIAELKASVTSKDKELQSSKVKLDALQDQQSQTQIDQF